MAHAFGGTEKNQWSRVLFWASLTGAAYHAATVSTWAVFILNDRYKRRILARNL